MLNSLYSVTFDINFKISFIVHTHSNEHRPAKAFTDNNSDLEKSFKSGSPSTIAQQNGPEALKRQN